MKNKTTVLGAGAWGTAMATLLANNDHDVVLWCYEPEVANDINNNQINGRYLPGIALPQNIQATNDLRKAVQASAWLFEAIPVKALRPVFVRAKEWVTPDHHLVILSKGIEAETLFLPGNIITETLGAEARGRRVSLAVLSGPNFAHELAQQAPTATVVAADERPLVLELTKMLNNQYFKVYGTDDVIGVQVGGAFKNVMALALGVAHGVKYHENTIAYLLTQALHEMAQVSLVFGGRADTVYGLSGLGDLALCCTGSASRNFKVGKLLGQGRTLSDLAAQYSLLPEGVGTLQAMKPFAQKHGLNLPLCLGTYDFVFEGKSFDGVLNRLMGV